MKHLISITLALISINLSAQIISKFTWDSDPLTTAEVGPDAISVSSEAYSAINGVGGTNGLTAGTNKVNIDFIIADDPIFNVGGIDVSFDYQRDESSGTFFKRGNSLIINGCAQLSVSYRVDDGAGGFNTVSSGSVYNIPNDDTFRNYRFIYLPVSGTGTLMVDGVSVWSNDGPDARDMYWTGAGNIIIGQNMDGTGFDRAFLDNFIIAEVTNSPLPVQLTSFSAEAGDKVVNINWETASELNNDYFTIERSQNGFDWEELTTVKGKGNSTTTSYYKDIDSNPFFGQSYYRLMQTDLNGSSSYSKIAIVLFESTNDAALSVYPNPTKDIINISSNYEMTGNYYIVNSIGQHVSDQLEINLNSSFQTSINMSPLPNGMYFIFIDGEGMRVLKN